jgi:uncharacterized hydrophobic protein (TIGR00271 family)
MASATPGPDRDGSSSSGAAPDTGLEERGTDNDRSRLGKILDWWRTRHQGTTPEERRRVIDTMFTTGGGTRTGRFWALQAFAIVIATMGLSANSAAVVIGAMLVAPLMTPIMAVATSLALGWPQRAIVPLVGTLLASAGSVALAFVLHSLITTPSVTDEILARTSPDLRDLFIALAAGAAGALGTAREDVSASLPGVAVAVALVPPLATIGVCLQMGQMDLASGAFLLFATNLVAIVLAGILVLLWCGFVPARLIERGRVAVWSGAAVTLAALVVVGIPLTIRTVEAATIAENNRAVTEAVIGWLDRQPQLELVDLRISETVVRVDVSGPEEPTDVAALTRRIESLLSPDTATTVRWSIRSTAIDDDQPDEADPPADEATESDDLDVIRSIVDSWAAEEAGIDVAGVSVGDEKVVVDVVGERAPTTVGQLAESLQRATGRDIEAEVRFSQRITVGADPTLDRRSTIAAAVTRALGSSDLAVDAVRFRDDSDGLVREVVLDISGAEPPSEPATLVRVALEVIEDLDGFVDDPEIVIRFTERRVLDLSDPDADADIED